MKYMDTRVTIGTYLDDALPAQWRLAAEDRAQPGVVAGADMVAINRIVDRVVTGAAATGCEVELIAVDRTLSPALDGACATVHRTVEAASKWLDNTVPAAMEAVGTRGSACPRLVVVLNAEELFRGQGERWARAMSTLTGGGIAPLAVVRGLSNGDFGDQRDLRRQFIRGNAVQVATFEREAIIDAGHWLGVDTAQVRALRGDGQDALLFEPQGGTFNVQLDLD